jgi:hypothetical protein
VSLNHGVGFDTAAIELILSTGGDSLGLPRNNSRTATHRKARANGRSP